MPGHVRLQPQDFYFNDLLADCCRSVQSLATARKIRLDRRCAGDVAVSAATRNCCAAS